MATRRSPTTLRRSWLRRLSGRTTDGLCQTGTTGFCGKSLPDVAAFHVTAYAPPSFYTIPTRRTAHYNFLR